MNLGLKITALSLVTIGFLYAGSDNEIASSTSGVSAQNVKKTNYLSRASCLLDGACFINYSLKAGEFQQIKDQLDQNMQDLSKLPVKVRYDRRFQVPNTDNGGGIYNFMNKMYQNPVALSGVYNVGTADAPVLKKWCAWVYKPTKNDPSFIEISDSFVRYSDDKRNGLYFLHENKELADSTKASFPRKAYSAEFDSSLHTDKNAGAETFNVSVVKYQTPKAHINDTTFESIYPTYIDDGNADACPSHGSIFQPLADHTSVTDISKFGNPTSGASRSDGLNPRIFLAEGIIDYLNKEIDDYAAYYTNAGLSASAIKSSASALTPSEYIKTLNGGAYNAKTANPSSDREGAANVVKEAGKNEIKDHLKILYDLNEENDFGVANTAQVNSFKEIDGKRFAVENALRYYYNIGQLGENGKEIIPEKRPIFIKGYSNPTVLYDPNPDSDLNKCAKGLSLNDSHGWKILNSSCLFYNPAQAVPPIPRNGSPITQASKEEFTKSLAEGKVFRALVCIRGTRHQSDCLNYEFLPFFRQMMPTTISNSVWYGVPSGYRSWGGNGNNSLSYTYHVSLDRGVILLPESKRDLNLETIANSYYFLGYDGLAIQRVTFNYDFVFGGSHHVFGVSYRKIGFGGGWPNFYNDTDARSRATLERLVYGYNIDAYGRRGTGEFYEKWRPAQFGGFGATGRIFQPYICDFNDPLGSSCGTRGHHGVILPATPLEIGGISLSRDSDNPRASYYPVSITIQYANGEKETIYPSTPIEHYRKGYRIIRSGSIPLYR